MLAPDPLGGFWAAVLWIKGAEGRATILLVRDDDLIGNYPEVWDQQREEAEGTHATLFAGFGPWTTWVTYQHFDAPMAPQATGRASATGFIDPRTADDPEEYEMRTVQDRGDRDLALVVSPPAPRAIREGGDER